MFYAVYAVSYSQAIGPMGQERKGKQVMGLLCAAGSEREMG